MTLNTNVKDETLTEQFYFNPPLYVQRYLNTVDIIENYGNRAISKIVDIGCSEMQLFQYLKRMKKVKQIVMLDIDEQVLIDYCHRVNPLATESILKRDDPLSVTVACADAKYSHSLTLGADVVTMIEFIEHLYPEELNPVIKNVFGVISPTLVIISTPNYNFNRLFAPKLPLGKLRHHDHKFEWTQKEFQEWCQEVVTEFPQYKVNFDGCGTSWESDEFCSQFGIFCRQSTLQVIERDMKTNQILSPTINYSEKSSSTDKPCGGCLTNGVCGVIHIVEYPFDSRSADQKFTDDVGASLESLRLWLSKFVISWEEDSGDTKFSCQFFSTPPWEEVARKKESFKNPEHDIAVETFLQIPQEVIVPDVLPPLISSSEFPDQEQQVRDCNEEEEDWKDFFSFDSEDDLLLPSPPHQPGKAVESLHEGGALASSSKSQEPERVDYFFKSISSFDSLAQICDAVPIDNTFFYIHNQRRFFIPLATFCSWTNLSKVDRVGNIFMADAQVTMRDVSSTLFIDLLLQEESESEDLDDPDDIFWEMAGPDLLDHCRI